MFYFIIVLVVLLILLVSSLIYSLVKGAPYMPTPKEIIREMLRLAEVKPGEVVYDLGSGDGRVMIVAVQEFDARAVGIEISMIYYWWSKIKIRLLGLSDKIVVRREDIFKANLSGADVVIMFLLQSTNARLVKVLKKELKPGVRIVSRYFTFPDFKPVKVNKRYHLYLYKFL